MSRPGTPSSIASSSGRRSPDLDLDHPPGLSLAAPPKQPSPPPPAAVVVPPTKARPNMDLAQRAYRFKGKMKEHKARGGDADSSMDVDQTMTAVEETKPPEQEDPSSSVPASKRRIAVQDNDIKSSAPPRLRARPSLNTNSIPPPPIVSDPPASQPASPSKPEVPHSSEPSTNPQPSSPSKPEPSSPSKPPTTSNPEPPSSSSESKQPEPSTPASSTQQQPQPPTKPQPAKRKDPWKMRIPKKKSSEVTHSKLAIGNTAKPGGSAAALAAPASSGPSSSATGNMDRSSNNNNANAKSQTMWDPYTNLSIDDLDRAKSLVLDLLGWGVEPEYLVNCGVSAQLIYRVFTDLNLRLPVNLRVPP
ncbi:hypothetical protein CC2G_014707 [Coprinopsis cinerea AmutBmut pab1-1]|nr:hypothetical protein CC2G_014707 [Coprinopsis cinerea AmutBmut pab1-1]